MRGTLVIARRYDGSAIVRRVWETCSKIIYLSEESQFQLLSKGAEGLAPVGFPREDVFAYDPKVVSKLGRSSFNWKLLRKFEALSRQDDCTKNGAIVSGE